MGIVKINRGDEKGFPVRIRGVVYATQRAAARGVGVSEKTIRNALDTGTVDLVGKGYRKNGRPRATIDPAIHFNKKETA